MNNPAPQKTPYLEMKGITKQFPGVLAVDDVDFSVELGKVVALVGENGAGKSTLMKVLTGVHNMDKGKILIEGKHVDIDDPLSAKNLGVSIIYQELMDIPNMNIAENIFVGREKRNTIFVDKQAMHKEAEKLMARVALNIDTHTLVAKLSPAQRQMLEVAKALSMNARVIIMDEPTSSLTETETQVLFDIIKRLKDENVAIVFISHRMDEITSISDEVAVLRDGKMVGRLSKEEIEEQKIISMMVGREISDIFAKEETEITDIAMDVFPSSKAHFDLNLIDVAVGQNFYNMGYLSVENLYKSIIGEPIDGEEKEGFPGLFITTGVQLVTPENYEEEILDE